MKLRVFSLFIFHFSLFTFCVGQGNSTLTKKQVKERDSLMAVSILNLDSGFVFVQGGSFEMGLPDTSTVEGGEAEKPPHKVTLKDFYILKTQVTQALWYSIMDTNPSFHKNCYTCPVENVTWYDAQKFIVKLNKLKKGRYRLPTEAEYEYAAGGGSKAAGRRMDYSGSNNVDEVAWYTNNSDGKSHPVGEKKPNELGLFDMSGNMWEWCSDWYAKYSRQTSDDPQGPAKGVNKVLRGGTWLSLDEGCMVISRGGLNPSSKDKFTGFRIVRDL